MDVAVALAVAGFGLFFFSVAVVQAIIPASLTMDVTTITDVEAGFGLLSFSSSAVATITVAANS